MPMTRAVLMLGILLVGVLAASWVEADMDAVRERVSTWQKAWETRDFQMYCDHYHPAFRSGELDHRAWIERKRELFDKHGPFSVDIFGVSVFMENTHAVVRFVQYFLGSDLSDVGEKTLILEPIDGTWKIISEEWRPLTAAPPRSEVSAVPAPVRPVPERSPAGSERHPEAIVYRQFAGDREQVCIRLSRFFIPQVFTLNGEQPRIVIDIREVSRWDAPRQIDAGGARILRIRSYLHSKEGKLRVVLDLKGAEGCLIDQTYFNEENRFCLDVSS